ncbi:MAG: EAL domain-containing protein [Hyphomonadaceae bacterium]|nr:EAL domain-containing protein [Hyphomonadaceae bacterium]
MPLWAKLRPAALFARLSTKLTVLYAGLFGVGLVAIALMVNTVISANAQRTVRDELAANGAVFDRIWALQEKHLGDSAAILARDFGFRDAVATRDVETILSALDNLRGRLAIDRAFLMTMDGDVVGLDALTDAEADALWVALDARERAAGVLTIAGRPYQAVSAPIRAPDLIGWVVFAAELNRAHLQSFEALAAIPLRADVFARSADGAWLNASSAAVLEALDADVAPRTLRLAGGEAIALAQPLRAFDGGPESRLLLTYPLDRALQAYRPLMGSLAALGVFGVALLALASWFLASTVTKPIAALDAAARALQQGKRMEVATTTRDEIGRLADTFNRMSHEIAAREERITHMAMHDADTGLANRRALAGALGAMENAYVVAVAIDRFAPIRDAIGYRLAAELLRRLGARLQAAAPAGVIARIGPDALALAIACGDEADALACAERLRAAAAGATRLDGANVDIETTAGAAPVESGATQAALDHALIAIEQARQARRRTALFDKSLYGDPARNLSLMSEMLDGITRGDLTLHYQPKYDLRRGAVTGVEALARWTHATRGGVSPDLFVTMAEETGHIDTLTEWTLVRAIADQNVMRAAGLDYLVSVNLSGRLVGDDAFTKLAIELIQDTDARICLEVTETAAMDDPEAALRNIEAYVAAGVSIAIDDFGAGLSSLSYLKRIPAAELKMDKSLIKNLGRNARDALLVKSTIDLAHALGMKITAEGVETQAELALLASMGCDMIQGYVIARPAPVQTLAAAPQRATLRT